MGGNVIFDGIAANSISLTPDARKTFSFALDQFFESAINFGIWEPETRPVDIASGSTKHIFNQSLDDQITLNDLDFQVDEKKLDWIECLDPGIRFGTFTLIGKKSTPMSLITLWKTIWGNIQIDFEKVEFESGLPTEWAQFAFSSPLIDYRVGIKGVAHKLMLRALTARFLEKRHIQGSNGEIKTELCSKWAFSNKGLRLKYWYLGNSVYEEIPRSDWVFETDPGKIAEILFGLRANKSRIRSFTEILWEISENFSPDDKIKVTGGMMNLLFGPYARAISRDPLKDWAIKNRISEYMFSILY